MSSRYVSDPRVWSGPFSETVPGILAVAYFSLLTFVLLYPFAFTGDFQCSQNTARWDSATQTIRFGQSGMLRTQQPPVRMYRELVARRSFSIESWFGTDAMSQSGPARILTSSPDPWDRNFTIAQSLDTLVVRLKANNELGMLVHKVDARLTPGNLQHLVVTYDGSRTRVFLDGVMKAVFEATDADLQDWDLSYPLVLGNENTGGRAWKGRLRYLAVYSDVLDAGEVTSRYRLGPNAISGEKAERIALLSYDFSKANALPILGFSEPGGQRVRQDKLTQPVCIPTGARPFLSLLGMRFITGGLTLQDTLLNIVLFLPFGWFVARLAQSIGIGSAAVLSIALAASLIGSGIFEIAQYYLPGRYSSAFDVAMNGLGGLLGGAVYLAFAARSSPQSKSCIS